MPPPSSATTTTTTIFFLILFPLLITSTITHTCSPPPSTTTQHHCPPPFTPTVHFPFSSSPGCGHPSFQIQCSRHQNSAIISINNLSFSILHYESKTNSLTLSPTKPRFNQNCKSSLTLSIPNKQISLSNSPFRVSDSSCSRLSSLKPCPPPNLPNCSHCPWECSLIKKPARLLDQCLFSHRKDNSQQGCQTDILEYLDNFVQLGFEVEWDEEQDRYFTSCKACRAINGVCGFNAWDPNKPFICFPSDDGKHSRVEEKSPNRVAMLSILFLFMCFVIIITIGTIIMRSRRNDLSKEVEEDPTIVYLRRHRSASLLPPVFTYDDLELSTNHFDPKRKIGDGGFGSVFLGKLYDGHLVAVKYLHKQNPNTGSISHGKDTFSTKSFCNEILILSSINHPNLVKLHGYCSDPRGLLLVYDYVPNGTLADHLHGSNDFLKKRALTWNLRVDIALQIAIAMEYLHFSVVPPIVHRDITSSNIFVEKDMRVKVGDFGLSRLLVCTETTIMPGDTSGGVCTGPQGTPGYLDPDYYRSFRLNEKSDIYSFGVVLLELITGLRAVDQRREKREVALADMVVSRIHLGLLHQVVDPILVMDGEETMEGVDAMGELAFRCVATDKDDRPDAGEVVVELRRIKGRGGCGGRGGGMLRMSNSSNMVVPDAIGLIDN